MLRKAVTTCSRHIDDAHAVVLDLDGTLWKDEVVIEGAQDYWNLLVQRQIPVVLLTNSGERTSHDVRLKFEAIMGKPVCAEQIWTALDNTARALSMQLDNGTVDQIWVIAPASNRAWQSFPFAKRAVSFEPGMRKNTPQVRHMLALLTDGGIPGDYLDMCVAVADELLDGTSMFVTSNDDTLAVVRDGKSRLKPGPGMFLQAVFQLLVGSPEASARVRIFGKGTDPSMPEIALVKLREQGFSGRLSDICFVGDRLNADVRAALQVGCIAVHVESGCHDATTYTQFPLDTPHAAAPSISHLTGMFDERLRARVHNAVRDTLLTTSHRARRGDMGDFVRVAMRGIDRWARMPPRRIHSLPNLSELVTE